MKKRVLFLIISIFIIAGVGYCVINSFFPDMCSNSIYKEVISPDSRHKAVMFQRNCGATTGFSTQISIIYSDSVLKNVVGNLFISKGHPKETGVEIKWKDSNTLIISNTNKLRIYKNKSIIEDIKIIYK